MTRQRISTTVDAGLLADARERHGSSSVAELIDAALTALVVAYRRAEIDQAYERAYERHPLDEIDEWGDLESFRAAAGAT